MTTRGVLAGGAAGRGGGCGMTVGAASASMRPNEMRGGLCVLGGCCEPRRVSSAYLMGCLAAAADCAAAEGCSRREDEAPCTALLPPPPC